MGIEKKINWLTYASLMALALGSYTSMTFSALAHIFIIIPILYFIPKFKLKDFSKGQWALFCMVIAMAFSVFVNQDIAVKGYAPLSKLKYYLLALLSIAPLQNWYQSLLEEDRNKAIRRLIFALVFTSIVASLYGMARIYLGWNFLHLKFSDQGRNTGFFGMVLNYAHNMSFLLIFLWALLLHRKRTKHFIGTSFLVFSIIVSLLSLYATYSRGAILAFLVAVPFLFFFKNIKKFIVLACLSILFLIAGMTVPQLKISRIGSDLERLSQWKTAIVAFKERPLFGVGYLNFEQKCPELKIKYDIDQKHFCGHAHNNFLEILADTGIIGFFFFVLWIFYWFIEMYQRRDLVAEVTIPLMVVFLVGGMTQATFTLGANLFLIMGIYSLSMIKTQKKG